MQPFLGAQRDLVACAQQRAAGSSVTCGASPAAVIQKRAGRERRTAA
jgi:hypothetical protein